MTHKFNITHHSGENPVVEVIESNGMEVRTTQQGTGNYLIEYKMNISLENWLRDKLDEIESMHEYSIATDTVRAWIDLYNDLKVKEDEIK